MLGRFVLREEIARGGMGVVYAATDPTFDREVAVKVLAERLAGHPPSVRRFLAEARISAQLQHPGIPPVHEVGTLPDGRPYLAMKRIKGRTLAELLAARKHLEPDRRHFLSVFESVCQAVGYAHSRGIVHRDLKPANVMVGAFGEVQVMDWGLAKLLERPGVSPDDPAATRELVEHSDIKLPDDEKTRAGTVMGTPAFMPPEQAGGETDRIDRRADVFSLGALLCVILTGKPPYTGDSTEAVRLQAIRGETREAFARLDAINIESSLCSLCKWCLAADRDARPGDATVVAGQLATIRTAAEDKARRSDLALELSTPALVEAAMYKARAEENAARADASESKRFALARELERMQQQSRQVVAGIVCCVALLTFAACVFAVFSMPQFSTPSR
jgi:serine/threonine protein kinase